MGVLVKDSLLSFLSRIDDKEMLIDIINKNNISFLVSDMVKDDKIAYRKILARKMIQKMFYDLVQEELGNLIDEYDKAGIKLVFVKGIFLTADLYENMSDRSSKDIDVSIRKDDFLKSHNLLKKMGYVCKDFTDDEIRNDRHWEYFREQHICYEKMYKKIKIYLEVHGNIVNAGEAFDIDTDEFINNSNKVDILNLQPYILSPEYNLIYLALHFIKHVPLNYTHYSIMGLNPEINIGNLVDIALFIKKYKDEIDWEAFYVLTKKMNVVRYIYAAVKLMNDIFTASFHEEIMNRLKQNIEHTHFSAIEYERSGWGKFYWLFDQTLEVIEKHSLLELISGNMLDYIDLLDISMMNSKHIIPVRDRYLCEQNFKVFFEETSEWAYAKLSVEVDRSNINISYSIDNKDVVPYEGKGKIFNCDGIDILVVNSDKIVHRLISIAKDEEGYYLVKSTQANFCGDIERLTEIDYVLGINEKSCAIKISYPWDLFGVNLAESTIIPFNVAGLITNPQTFAMTGNHQLFANENDLFDFRYIPVLQFT